MNEYFEYVRQHNGEISGGVFEKIKNADERLFMTWIVDVLEKGKSDFVKEKLSILGENMTPHRLFYILNHKNDVCYCI